MDTESGTQHVEDAEVEITHSQETSSNLNENTQIHEQNNTVLNNDNIASSSTVNSTTKREKCAFGQNCYRKNIHHKTKFSHPGDPDYDLVDTRPQCPFGIRCYRKNPQHKREYQHTRIRPQRQSANPNINFDLYFSSDEESVDESEYDPTELEMNDDDEDFDYEDLQDDESN